MKTNQVINPQGFNANITAFAFQYWARDFFEAYKSHKTTAKFSPARFYLICRSLELAFKSLHLAKGRKAKDLYRLGHDLEKAADVNILKDYGISLTIVEGTELKKANDYYKNKGFEYFLFNASTFGVLEDRSGAQMALSGYPNLPNEGVMRTLAEKVLKPI